MDLVTAVSVLVQQAGQLNNLIVQLSMQADNAMALVNQENSVPTINPQIHSLTASMSIIMTAINSQDVMVQQAIDKVAELSA